MSLMSMLLAEAVAVRPGGQSWAKPGAKTTKCLLRPGEAICNALADDDVLVAQGRSRVVMEIKTTRFGVLRIADSDVLSFPEGIPGIEQCKSWVLLPDLQNGSLAWLQSTTVPEIALAVVSPRKFVTEYTVRVSRAELKPLAMADKHDAQVLSIVSVHEGEATINLKAPLVINRRNRTGRQVVTNGDMPLRYGLSPARAQSGPTQQRQAA